MRSVSDNSCRQNQNTFHPQQLPTCPLPLPENRAVCGITWKKYVAARLATDDDLIRLMHLA
jgi:hypothetical protein